MGRFGGVLKRAGENILGKIHSETAMPMASERYEGVEASYYFLTQTFFLGGTSPKCPSYHSLVLHPPLPTPSPPFLRGERVGVRGDRTPVCRAPSAKPMASERYEGVEAS